MLETRQFTKASKPRYEVFGLKASYDEYMFAKKLNQYEEEGMITNTIFQAERITLIPAIKGQLKNWRASTYTPDFSFTDRKGNKHIIEVKGFSGRGSQAGYNNMRHKLAEIQYEGTDKIFSVLKLRGAKKDGTKGFYDMYNPNLWKNKDIEVIKQEEFFTKLFK